MRIALATAMACGGALFLPGFAVAGEVTYVTNWGDLGTDFVDYDAEVNGEDSGVNDRITVTVNVGREGTVEANGALVLPGPFPQPYLDTLTNCTFVIGTARCRGHVSGTEIALRSGNDTARVVSIAGSHIYGGAGRDALRGGSGWDDLYGDQDPETGPVQPAADDLAGGPGSDVVRYMGHPTPVTVTLDDQPNDGVDGEGDNVHSDVERVVVPADPGSRVVGNDGDNDLSGGGELLGLGGADRLSVRGLADGGAGPDRIGGSSSTADTLIGGAGRDELSASGGADDVHTDDGDLDIVDCGAGEDSAIADEIDVLENCELVELR